MQCPTQKCNNCKNDENLHCYSIRLQLHALSEKKNEFLNSKRSASTAKYLSKSVSVLRIANNNGKGKMKPPNKVPRCRIPSSLAVTKANVANQLPLIANRGKRRQWWGRRTMVESAVVWSEIENDCSGRLWTQTTLEVANVNPSGPPI